MSRKKIATQNYFDLFFHCLNFNLKKDINNSNLITQKHQTSFYVFLIISFEKFGWLFIEYWSIFTEMENFSFSFHAQINKIKLKTFKKNEKIQN